MCYLKNLLRGFSSDNRIGIATRNSIRLVRYGSVGCSDASSPAMNGVTRPTSLSKLEIPAKILLALSLGTLLKSHDL